MPRGVKEIPARRDQTAQADDRARVRNAEVENASRSQKPAALLEEPAWIGDMLENVDGRDRIERPLQRRLEKVAVDVDPVRVPSALAQHSHEDAGTAADIEDASFRKNRRGVLVHGAHLAFMGTAGVVRLIDRGSNPRVRRARILEDESASAALEAAAVFQIERRSVPAAERAGDGSLRYCRGEGHPIESTR